MRTRISTSIGVVLVLLMSGSARAQDRPVHFNFGGGPTFVFGDLSEGFSTGWGPAVGVTFNMTPRVGFQFEYAYRWFDAGDDLPLQATRFSANHQTHQLAFNLVANMTGPDSGVRVYAVAGPGMYYRKVEITEYEGSGIICDPWYYVCGTYPITSVVGSRGGWDFGFNVGAGVGLPIGEEAEFYIESRYHYIWGPEIVPPAGSATTTAQKVNGLYLPLTFGFRF
jgi:opacity protein-like surface antigen